VLQACCLPRLENGLATSIVAHIVPARSGDGLADELRSRLGERLPSYMLPAQFVLHRDLPLTPYGKVDRRALTDSHLKAAEPARIETNGDGLDLALSRLWNSLLPAASSSPPDAVFSSLGGDSLLTVKLMLGVEEIINQRLEVSNFLIQPTFPGLCQAVRERMSRTEFQPVLTLRKQGTRPPLFCLYQHQGDMDVYFSLAEALGDDQPVYGIRSPGLQDQSRLPVSIEAAAAEITGWIRKIQPRGAPAVIGYSWAGLLAFEVARQMAPSDGRTGFTALVGTDAPMQPTNFLSRLSHFARNFPPWIWQLFLDHENRWRRLARWQEMARGTKENLEEARLPEPSWTSSPISIHLVGLMGKYCPLPPANVVVDLFRERDSYQPKPPHPLQVWQTGHLPDGGWNFWARRPVRLHWVPGDHWTIMSPPAVTGLARAILLAMDHHYADPPPAPETSRPG
jgi:aspartate racemase